MSYFGVSLRNGVGLGLGTVPSLTNTPLSYRLAPSLNLSFAGSDTLDPRITFSRTTNATLTNSAGLVANAPMNLLTFSEQFDNAAWNKSSITVSANTVAAPNGTVTADTLTSSGASGAVFQTASSISAVFTYSVYVRPDTATAVELQIAQAGNGFKVAFNLTNGTAGAATIVGTGGTVSAMTGAIVSAGGGWYRCSVSYTSGGVGNAFLNVPSAGVVQVWGAQLELGSTATTYNPTTVKNLLGFTEHFDNAAWTKSNAFVQTNNLRWSEDFTNSLWIKGGTATASTPSTLNFPAVNDIVSQEVTMTATVGTAATFSVVLSGTGTVYLAAYRSGGGAYEQTRIKITLTTTPTRYSVTHTMVNSGNTGFGAYIARSTDGTATTFTATQAQLVNGTSAGDYKATYAAAAAVGYTDIYGQPFAQKLVESAVAGTTHNVTQSSVPVTSGAVYVASAYFKAGERTQAALQLSNYFTSASIAYFDLGSGTVVSNGAGVITSSITSIGNGWYRCSILSLAIATGTGGNFIAYTSVSGSATYTGDGTSGIYIFGAQLSDSASVDPYVYQPVAAPSSVAYYGPRFDYDPVTLAPKGLLIEEQRTNLLTYSEDFTNAAWIKTNMTVTANSSISPDGAQTADTLTSVSYPSTSASRSQALTAVPHTMSAYAKASSLSSLRFDFVTAGFALGSHCIFNLSTQTATITNYGATTGSTASVVPVGNGWFKCVLTVTTTAATWFTQVYGAGDGSILVWGAQLEAGAFATSYIPTVASQVTRAADSASMIGNNFARWYTQGPGSMFADVQSVNGVSSRAFTVSDSTINNQIFEANDILMNVYTGGAFQVQLGGTAGIAGKVAMAYATNDFAVVKNGGSATTDTSGSLASSYTQLNIGVNYNNTAGHLNGTIKRIAFYPRRLANSELQSITS